MGTNLAMLQHCLLAGEESFPTSTVYTHVFVYLTHASICAFMYMHMLTCVYISAMFCAVSNGKLAAMPNGSSHTLSSPLRHPSDLPGIAT